MHRRWLSIASLGALASLTAGASHAAMLQNTMPPDLILSEGSAPGSQLVAPTDIISVPTAPAAAVSAVPEPAGWAMMLVGFGGLGALLRRRRAAAA